MSKKVAKISLLVIALTLSILLPILAVTAKKPEWKIAPVYIDETIPGITWADWADEPWLKGSGTEEDPYMIKNVVIDAGGNFFCMLIMNSEAYFKIMDCTFSNSGPYNSPEGGRNAALILVGTQNGIIFKNEMFDCGFPGTELGGGIALVASSNNKVQKNYCHDNELSGIYVQYSNDNIIRQNLCTGNTWGIFISEWSNNNEVTKNECYDNEEHGILLWTEANGNMVTKNDCKGNSIGGITLSASHGNVLTDNECSYNQEGIILGDGASFNEVINNTCYENIESGILVESSYGNTISNNTCSENGGAGINLEFSYGSLIIQNLCSENRWGISMGYGSSNNEIMENDCRYNIEYGIFLLGNADYNTISNNNCMENLGSGIVLSGANGNVIFENYCAGHGGAGIVIVGWYGYARDNILVGNTVELNSYGVYFSYVNNNDIFRNTINNNIFGIFLEGYCLQNHIYHNNIIENDVQVSDDYPGLNNWHNIYMLEGNYWSDYNGEDTSWPGPGYDDYPFLAENGWDITTPEEDEYLNAFFDPTTNRLRGYATVRDDEICYIIIGWKESFSERTERLAFPPYTMNYQFDSIRYSFDGSFWVWDETLFGLPGYVQFFYKKVEPYYFTEDLSLTLGTNYFAWIIGYHDNDGFHELVEDRFFDLV